MAEDGKISYCAIHDMYPMQGMPCWKCINAHNPEGARDVLIEASYRIASETFKKIPRTKTIGFIRGYQKAGTIAHDVLKKMIEEAK